jgi:hypothetical protein
MQFIILKKISFYIASIFPEKAQMCHSMTLKECHSMAQKECHSMAPRA